MRSGVGWIRGRLPAGSGCRGLTVGGSSTVSSWCVSLWPLAGWLRGFFGVYLINGGTTVCWRAAVGCGAGACVGVVLGGSSWWSVVPVCGGWSWAWRFLGGCGTCGVGMVWGQEARVCGFVCSPPASSAVSSSAFPLPVPFCMFVFFGGGRVRVVGHFRCWAWVWVRAGAGVGVCLGVMGDGWLLRSWFPVCVSALRHLVAFGFWSPGPGGAGGGLLAAVVAWCLRGRSGLLGGAWVAWPDAGVRVGVFMAWAVWAVGTPLLGAGRLVLAWMVCVDGMGRGVGYVCAQGMVGGVWALWAMQWEVAMLVMLTGGCCRRRNGLVLLMLVLQPMRLAVIRLVKPMVTVS